MTSFVNDVKRTVVSTSRQAIGRYVRNLGGRGTISLPEVRALRVVLERYTARPVLAADPLTRVEKVRTQFEGREVRGEWVDRPGTTTRQDKVILYIHGGAFVSGSPLSHRGLTSEISARTKRPVFAVDYRLAPEYPFPAGADDVLRAYKWLLASGLDASRIVVIGDSAGGHLTLGLPPRAKRAGLAVPAGVVALSPVVDPTMALSDTWSKDNPTDLPGYFAAAGRAVMHRHWRDVAADDPELLLTNDDLTVMPPVLVQASDNELLAGDAAHYVEKLQAAGGNGRLSLFHRKFHVFQMAFRISKAASRALDEIAEFVDEVS